MTAFVIKANGEIDGLDNSEVSLEEAQKIVGGYVEVVSISGSVQLLVNEEGLIHQLPFNKYASELFGQSLVGDVLVLQHGSCWK